MADQKLLDAFAAKVVQRRAQLDVSQFVLADKSGLHFTTISAVETGRRGISLESLMRLAKGLEMTVSELVEGLPYPEDIPESAASSGKGRFRGGRKKADPNQADN